MKKRKMILWGLAAMAAMTIGFSAESVKAADVTSSVTVERNATSANFNNISKGYDLDELSNAEIKLIIKHPRQALKVKDCTTRALNYTKQYYGKQGNNDNSDAFRHCIWNAFMTKALGASTANTWATAHESASSGLSKEMDLYNNNIGRGISNVASMSDASIATAVKSKVSSGACRRIVNNKLVATDKSGLVK